MVLVASEICGAFPEEEDQPAGEYGPDLKPEYCRYSDEGCEYARSCLECPFPQCLYDKPGGRQHSMKELRNKEIKKLFRSGRKVKELAEIFELSQRTIERVLMENERDTKDNKTNYKNRILKIKTANKKSKLGKGEESERFLSRKGKRTRKRGCCTG